MSPSGKALFRDRERIRVVALCLGERIDLKPFGVNERLATGPLVVAAGATGCAVLFRYGAVVLFGLDSGEEIAFIDNIKGLVHDPLDVPIMEETTVLFDPESKERSKGEGAILKNGEVERLQIVADVLAKSVVLERYEIAVQEGFEQIEPLALRLKQRGGVRHGARSLLRNIGNALLVEHKMVNRVQVGEKPELLWDRDDLTPLYVHLEREYELADRQSTLESKLRLISRTVQTVLDLLNHRRSLRVEWYIVILIVAEIFLSLYQMFSGAGTH